MTLIEKFTNQTLAVKYRPKTFDELIEQNYIKQILLNQLNTGTFKQAYLFCGPAGDGKTTTARIFANEINKGRGKPIELDAASHNGVEDVRQIIEDSKKKPIDSEYKVFICDEVHSFSNNAWQALLKLLEEPPKTAIFILCTTDPQKIPATILSRVQRYNFNRISVGGIQARLKQICDLENQTRSRKDKITADDEALAYIAKCADGGMRNGITMLDKILSLINRITVDDVANVLGDTDIKYKIQLLDALVYRDAISVKFVEQLNSNGINLSLYLKQFQFFILDVLKFKLFSSLDFTSLPPTNQIKVYCEQLNYNDVADVLDMVVELNNKLRWETAVKELIECHFMLFCRGNNK